MARVLSLTVAAAAIMLACGGDGLNAPAPDTRVVQGSQGWQLAVPSAPVTPGDEVKIWFNGSELEPGPRVDIRIEVRVPDGSVGGGAHTNLGAPGWTWLPFRNTGAVGIYKITILDPQTRKTFVEAEFRVEEE